MYLFDAHENENAFGSQKLRNVLSKSFIENCAIVSLNHRIKKCCAYFIDNWTIVSFVHKS